MVPLARLLKLTGIVAGAAPHVQGSGEGGSKIGQFALHVVRCTGVRRARCLVMMVLMAMMVIVVHRRRIVLQIVRCGPGICSLHLLGLG